MDDRVLGRAQVEVGLATGPPPRGKLVVSSWRRIIASAASMVICGVLHPQSLCDGTCCFAR